MGAILNYYIQVHFYVKRWTIIENKEENFKIKQILFNVLFCIKM